MDGISQLSISPETLYARLGNAAAPRVVDLRVEAAIAGETVIIGAVGHRADRLDAALPTGRPVALYCADGGAVSRDAAAGLRAGGVDARHLEGGMALWRERGLPCRRRLAGEPRAWVTRERPKIDRIACPWLIRRFIDPGAQFLYVPAETVFAAAAETGAAAYDIPGAAPFAHDGEACTFDAFLKVYDIADPALGRLAAIVRGADIARLELAVQSAGLLAVSQGLSLLFSPDHSPGCRWAA
jgi:rhodanese-related sulfurtransferase